MLSCLFCFFANAVETEHIIQPLWSFHQENYETYSPQLSVDNNQLVYVRKLHVPDGHEAELYPPEKLQKIRDQVKTNPRFEDPEIVIINLADQKDSFIDYGWTPTFSPDQTKILYAHQKNPISGLRVLASSLAGNDIREYDLDLHKSTLLVQPSSGYLSKPVYAENKILFALSGALNGAYGGDIGVGEFDPATGRQKELYRPMQEHGIYHWVQHFVRSNAHTIVLRSRPLTTGIYMADLYVDELIDAENGELLYRWPERKNTSQEQADFRICPAGMEIYDQGWRTTAQIKPALQEEISDSSSGVSSPDCSFIAQTSPMGVTLHTTQGASQHWHQPEGSIIQSMSWSPDSSRLILVISHMSYVDEKFKFDEVIILPAKFYPTEK